MFTLGMSICYIQFSSLNNTKTFYCIIGVITHRLIFNLLILMNFEIYVGKYIFFLNVQLLNIKIANDLKKKIIHFMQKSYVLSKFEL